MLAVLILFNILVFCGGVYTLINKAAPVLNQGIKIITAIVIVFTMVSYAYYLSLPARVDIIILADVFTLLNLILIAFNTRAYKKLFTGKFNTGINNYYAIIPLFAVLVLTGYFFFDAKRWGDGDAIVIWNMHAQFLFDVNTWKLLFKNGAHPDYPLMLPAFIAFFWRTIDSISPFIPVLIAYFPLILIPLLVYFALFNSKNNWFAWLALVIFALSSNFINLALSQGADTLLALFILLTFILYNNLKISPSLAYFVGFVAAASTWVKNEGMLFLVVFTVMLLITNRRDRGGLLKYAAGTILPLIVLASFKLCYAPQNDLVGNSSNTSLLLHHLADYHRYLTIARYLCSTLFYFYWDVLILLLAAVIVSRRFFKSPLFMVVLLVIVGYFTIYVTSPFDLHWHLSTSADRVLQHFYPALVYGILLSFQAWCNNRAAVNAVS